MIALCQKKEVSTVFAIILPKSEEAWNRKETETYVTYSEPYMFIYVPTMQYIIKFAYKYKMCIYIYIYYHNISI